MSDETQENETAEKSKQYNPWDYAKFIIITVAAIGLLIRIYTLPPDQFNIEFSTLLSVLLAFFSIWLSAQFYFKATDTSNKFYDNNYQHTKDIALLLTKIESGFGEKLSNIHEKFDYFKPENFKKETEETKKKITKKEEQLDKISDAYNKIIDDLINKTTLNDAEKEEYRASLKEKELALEKSKAEVSILKEQLNKTFVKNPASPYFRGKDPLLEKIIQLIGVEIILTGDKEHINHRFKKIFPSIEPQLAFLLKDNGMISQKGNFTSKGHDFIKAKTLELYG